MKSAETTRVAAVQALAHTGEEEYRNVERALRYAEEAAGQGARLVCFPEAYPGPATGPMDWGGRLDRPAEELLAEQAKRLGVYIAAGGLEACPEAPDAYYVTQKLYSPEGMVLCNYRRVQPDNPDLNAYFFAGRRHVVPGEEIAVVPTEWGRIGLQICGELFVPEIARIQMLLGADMILSPVNGRKGTFHLRGIWQTWQHIARARAAENIMYVIIPVKFLENGPGGAVAIIAGPEAMIARSTRPGVLVADLDLDRLRWLRNRYVDQELLSPPPSSEEFQSCATRCGQVRDRRPELYGPLIEPQPGAFDFWYYRRGLETWNEEMERVKSQPHTLT